MNHLDRMRAKQQQLPAGTVAPAVRPKKLKRPAVTPAPAVEVPAPTSEPVAPAACAPASPPPQANKKKFQTNERLPDGSKFEVRYDATEVRWSGTLTIPDERGPRVFRGNWRALFGLLIHLDCQYRACLKRQVDKEAGHAE